MKRKILFISLLVLTTVSLQAQINDPVIARIAEMKLNVEAAAQKKLEADSNDVTTADDYNRIKAPWNAAISQFQYELNRRPRLWKKFNEVNKRYYQSESPSNDYDDDEIDFFAREIAEFLKGGQQYIDKHQLTEKMESASASYLAAIELLLALEQEWRAIQSEKAKGLSEILNTLRLEDVKQKDKKKPGGE